MDYQGFFSMLNFIDGVTIIDSSGTIIFSINFNPEKNNAVFDTDEVVGKRLSEVFPNIVREKSTLFKAMEKGIPVFKQRQTISTAKGDRFETMNVSIPIRINRRIVGSIELSRYLGSQHDTADTEITLSEDMSRKISMHKTLLGNDTACYDLTDIITNDPEMYALKSQAEKFSKSSAPVFICGETGTGKELFAHAIHNAGRGKQKPFITQNCAAIPETLLESILFGTAKGCFTGAVESPGLFEAAGGGTIFLDEINSMPLHLQTKLLRVLQDGCVRRVGGHTEKRVDVRIITASSNSPEECIQQKVLRQDIYYRLCVLTMSIPPLRERKHDIELLLHYFITKYNDVLKTSIHAVSKRILETFMEYSWPGNVRELEHIVEYALHMVEPGEITLRYEHVAERFNILKAFNSAGETPDTAANMKDQVRNLEVKMIKQALEDSEWNFSGAARILGINRQTLQNKIKQYDIR